MTLQETIERKDDDNLAAMVARKIMAGSGMILPFADFSDLLTDILHLFYYPSAKVIGAGLISPEVAQAADRAQMEVAEETGSSPFAGDTEAVLNAVTSPHDIVFVANPNRITGANYSLADLEQMARAVPNGALVVDEYYHDYFGISALPLLDILTNVVILRSFTACFSIGSSDAGYVIATPVVIKDLAGTHQTGRLSLTVRKTMLAAMNNTEAMVQRLREVHDESLRIANALHQKGVQCRILATDYILLRVADPKSVGNHLASHKVPIENLDGYPGMKNYIRYRIQSHLSNDRMIEAFRRMPAEFFRMKSLDRRAVVMHQRRKDGRPRIEPPADINNRLSGVREDTTAAEPVRHEQPANLSE